MHYEKISSTIVFVLSDTFHRKCSIHSHSLEGTTDEYSISVVTDMQHEHIAGLRKSGNITIEGHEITTEDIKIIREFKGDNEVFEAVWTEHALVVLNLTIEESMRREGLAREIINRAQKLKKKAGLNVTDPVEIFIEVLEDKDDIKALLETHQEYIQGATKYPLLPISYRPANCLYVHRGDDTIGNNSKVRVHIIRATFSFDEDSLKKKCPSDKYARDLELFVATRNPDSVQRALKARGKVAFPFEGATVELVLGEDIFLSAGDLYARRHPQSTN